MRYIFYISTLAILLAACSKGDDPAYVPEEILYSTTPITLDVASSAPIEAQSRAYMKGVQGGSTGPWAIGDHIVVNALYYNSAITTLGQQFLDDQTVTATITTNNWNNSSTTTWNYAPVKYWPQQGYVDFYAAYPKDYVDNNLDRQRLFHESLAGTVLSTRFYLDKPKAGVPTGETINRIDGTTQAVTNYSDAIEQWDLMFSHRPHLSKPDVTTPVKFHFSHAEMAVRFFTKELTHENIGGLIIKNIYLNNIHTGGTITATDATDWQAYYAEFPGAPGVETSTAGAQTPVKLSYDWDWSGHDPLSPDIRNTYAQTVDFLWYDGTTKPSGTQINTGDKVFIIPPQCLGAGSGSSITIDYIVIDIGDVKTYHSSTFNVDICGEPGKIVNIYINLKHGEPSHTYEIEPITATLTPWEDIYGSLSTDLEK